MSDLKDFLDGDDGVWYDRFGLWTQGKRDTAWLVGKLEAAGVTLAAPAEGLREAAQALIDAEDVLDGWDERANAEMEATGTDLYDGREDEVNALVGRRGAALIALRAALKEPTDD